jgi:hypothetical protein
MRRPVSENGIRGATRAEWAMIEFRDICREGQMKSSVTVTCKCGHQMTLQASGTQDIKDKQCTECGTTIYFIEPLGNVVRMRIFSRAKAELENEDFTLVIILSAIAVECELAHFFIKWNEVDVMDTRMPTPADKDGWEEQLRKFSIAIRLDKVSTLLTGEDFDSFLSHNPELLKPIRARYPTFTECISPKDFLKKEFFDKRNKIAHRGEIDFKQPDGEMCFTLAATLFQVMKEMDDKRIKAMDIRQVVQIAATSLPTV